MSKEDKLYDKINGNPKDVTPKDLLKLMDNQGFRKKKKTDGYDFYHEGLREDNIILNVAMPHGDKVKKTYVRRCLRAIELLKERQRQ